MAGKRIKQVLTEFNIALDTLVEFLKNKGVEVEENINSKIDDETYEIVSKEFRKEQIVKQESQKVNIKVSQKDKTIEIATTIKVIVIHETEANDKEKFLNTLLAASRK